MYELGEFRQLSQQMTKIVIDSSGNAVEQSLRVPCNGELAVIDALNITMDSETFDTGMDKAFQDLEELEARQYATRMAEKVGKILGYLLGDRFNRVFDTGVGRNFYKYTFRIGELDEPLGLIGLGNTSGNTVSVMIYGKGTHYAENNWEYHLHSFLTTHAVGAKITRCDLAVDDFDGIFCSAEACDKADSMGQFALTNKKPSVQHLGDWKRHEGRGRTLQIDKRQNGKLFRGYEKGKQLGDKDSFWFRNEVELGSKNRLIPLDILLKPTEYFAGSYPYCYMLVNDMTMAMEQESVEEIRIKTFRNETQISLDKAIEITKNQFGRYLRVFRDLFFKIDIYGNPICDEKGVLVSDDKQILDLLVCDKEDYYPKRLKLLDTIWKEPPNYYLETQNRWDSEFECMQDFYVIPYKNQSGEILIRHLNPKPLKHKRNRMSFDVGNSYAV